MPPNSMRWCKIRTHQNMRILGDIKHDMGLILESFQIECELGSIAF